MPVISKISTQKKNTDRYNIFLDHGQEEEYAFSVDEAVLVKFHLRKGLELTKLQIEEILYEEQIRKGYQYAINYLSYRMRSTKEMIDYLKSKELESNNITIIIDRLLKEKYLDDGEFAKAFVRSRINLTMKGPGVIRRELIEKGMSEKEINEALDLYSYEEQLEKAALLLQKKYPKQLKTSRADQDRKMYTLLQSKGFTNDVVQEVLRGMKEENEDDCSEEWQAITYQGEKALKKYRSYNGWEQKQKVKQFLYRRGFSFDLIDKFIEEHVTD